MSKFSSLVGGFQQGLGAGQDVRDRRQREKLYDTVLEQAQNDIGAKKRNKEGVGLPWEEVESDDPFGLRMFNWAKGLFGGAKGLTADTQASALGAEPASVAVADALPMGGGMAGEDPYGTSALGFADGGSADMERLKQREVAAQERQRLMATAGNISGQAMTAGPRATGAVLNGAADIIGQGTTDPIDGSYVGQYVERAFDAPRAMIADGLRGMAGGQQQLASALGAPPTDPEGASSGPIARNGPRTPAAAPAAPAPDMGGEMGPPSRGGSALGSPAAAATPAPSIDWSKVNQIDVPTMSTQDWQAFRDQRVRSYVDNGMVPADAEDKVDQQVIATQQRGMANYGRQAAALLQGGDLKGAAAALRAAYQYFPTTTDIKFGIQNGHLIGVTTDEDTGETVGEPWVVTPERVNNMLTYFANPAAFAEHAQDRRRGAQDDRRLDQADRGMDQQDQQLGISAQNAETQSLLAGAKAAGGQQGMRPGDALRYDDAVGNTVEALIANGQLPPEDRDLFLALAQAVSRARGGGESAQQTVNAVLARWRGATPEQRQELAQQLQQRNAGQ